jgi:hypothetical protein
VATVGLENMFLPAPNGRGQPTTFPAGSTVTNAVVVTWNGSALTWVLPGGTATGGFWATPCSSPPVPMVAGAAPALPFLLLAGASLWWLRRRGRLAWVLAAVRGSTGGAG